MLLNLNSHVHNTPFHSEALKFCGASESDLAPFLDRVKDGALRHALQYGVAFCHETMPAGDQEVVRLLFESGAVQVGRGGYRCRTCPFVCLHGYPFSDSRGRLRVFTVCQI